MTKRRSTVIIAAISFLLASSNGQKDGQAPFFAGAAESPKTNLPFSLPQKQSEMELEQADLKFSPDEMMSEEVEATASDRQTEEMTPFISPDGEEKCVASIEGLNSNRMIEAGKKKNGDNKDYEVGKNDGRSKDLEQPGGKIEEKSDIDEFEYTNLDGGETLSDKDYNLIIGSTLINPYASRTQSFIDAEAMNSNEVKDRCLQTIKEKDFSKEALENLIRKYELFLHTYQGQGGYAEDLLDTVEDRLSFCKEHHRYQYRNATVSKTNTAELEQTCFSDIYKDFIDGQKNSFFVKVDFLEKRILSLKNQSKDKKITLEDRLQAQHDLHFCRQLRLGISK